MEQIKSYKSMLLLLSIGLLVSACKSDVDINNKKFENIQGIWEQKGYGNILVIKNEKAEAYDYTRNSCLKSPNITSKELSDSLDKYKLADNKKSFTIKPQVFTLKYSKLNELPVFCLPHNVITQSTPTKVFTHFWHTFNDYYAFFDEHEVDWSQQYAKYYQHVNDDMEEEDLFGLLSVMLNPLDDGHVELTSDNKEFSPSSNSKFIDQLIEAFEDQTKYQDINKYVNAQYQRMELLPLDYVKNIKHAGGKNNNAVSWGSIGNNIAYIKFSRMDGFADNYTADNEDDVKSSDDIKALNKILDTILVDTENTSAMIIDVRLNPGGNDLSSMTIANRFASQRERVLSKYTRTYLGDSQQVHAYLEPTKETVSKPVVILSSEITASAAEIFLMAMNTQTNVTLIGEPSSGSLSDSLDKSLPNNWDVTLSNEVYLDYQGNNYEISGVPMDINVPALSLSYIQNNKDGALEKAITTLGYTVLK